MRILVGVMYCIENEFDRCLRAIDAQTHPAHDRFVLSGFRNKEAHDALYGTFMQRAGEVDLFVKIDADMVLSRNTFFEEVVKRFHEDPDLTHIQIALDDWFTQRRIMGLHVYRSAHRWVRCGETHFVDMVDAGGTLVSDLTQLAPAGAHSPDPSPFQAFHFGVHKAVKVLQRGRAEPHIDQSCTHWGHFSHLEANYRRSRDPRLGLAVAGFLHAIRYRYRPAHVDFTCRETESAFEHYGAMSCRGLDRACRHLGLYAWQFLPHSLRYELARYHGSGSRRPAEAGRVLMHWRSDRFNRYRTD